MFEPDVLLPEQYRALQGKVLSGEQRLLLAILADAIHCFQIHVSAIRPSERQIFREAEEWFEMRDTRWFFSFGNVCDLLGLDADHLRSAIRRWKAEQLSRRADHRPHQLHSTLRFSAFPRARSN